MICRYQSMLLLLLLILLLEEHPLQERQLMLELMRFLPVCSKLSFFFNKQYISIPWKFGGCIFSAFHYGILIWFFSFMVLLLDNAPATNPRSVLTTTKINHIQNCDINPVINESYVSGIYGKLKSLAVCTRPPKK
jgi:ABC-type uncharacterized transport system YnjBCD permease subunit